MDWRLKRRHQCRFVKMAFMNFSFAKFVALEESCPTIEQGKNLKSTMCRCPTVPTGRHYK